MHMAPSLKTRTLVILALLFLLSTEIAWAKTNLTRIVMEGPSLAAPLEISDWWELDLFGRAMRANVPINSPAPGPPGTEYTITVFRRTSVCCLRNEIEMGTFEYYPGFADDRGWVKNSPYRGCGASECWERASRYLDSWMASHVLHPAARPVGSPYLIYVVTADNEVLVVDPELGKVGHRIPVGASYRPRRFPIGESPAGWERPLRLGLSGSRLYVLDHDPEYDGDLGNSVGFQVIDPLSHVVQATYAVPTSEAYFWVNLAVAPAEDLVYLVGHRLVDVANHYWEVKVLEMETATGQLIQEYSLYPTGTVFQTAIDSAGSSLYLAYHGASDGVDVLGLALGSFFPPHRGELPAYGAIQAHGGVIRGPDGRMYAPTDGGSVLLAIQPSAAPVLEELPTGLGNSTHMPEMAASPTEDVLYLLGGCTAIEGSKKLYALNVRSAEFRALAEGTVCGRSLAVSPDGRFLAVLRDRPVPRDATISIIDARSGEIVRDIPLNTAALDLVAVPLGPTSLPVTGEEASPSVGTLVFMGAALVTFGLLLGRLRRGTWV